MMPSYPKARRENTQDVMFGVPVADPYRYLEDKTAPETIDLTARENAYTKAYFNARTDFSAAEREKALRQADEAKPPRYSGFAQACGVRCCTRELSADSLEIVLLDQQNHVQRVLVNDAIMEERMHVYSAEPNPCFPGLFLVRAVKHGAPRACCIVYDGNQNKVLAELDDLFSVNWSDDGRFVLYSSAVCDTKNNRNINRVHRYCWQQNQLQTLYEYPGNAVFIDVIDAPGGLLLGVGLDYANDQLLFLTEDGRCTALNDGSGSVTYLGVWNQRCYFKTDRNAPMSKIVRIRVEALSCENALIGAEDVLGEGDARLYAAGIVGDKIMAAYERDACSELKLFSLEGEPEGDIALPDPYGALSLPERIRANDAGILFLEFMSFLQEETTYLYDIASGQMQPMFPRRDSTDDLTVDKHFLKARDGQQLLVYLIRQKTCVPNGDTPVMMYGYGGYGSSARPTPENYVACCKITDWVRQGRIYAHCILRGGSEYGVEWHKMGMKCAKKNAFTDFIDIAEELIRCGWTRPEKLVATGMSNGGLLMTAVTTMRPDLFGTVIASVPHTDMLRFRNDDRGMMYVTEYGDPLESEEMFRYMYSYSPYHNIHPGTLYPYIYVQTGEMDNNVPCYHGKKFAVRLQNAADAAHPVVLYVLPHGSHSRGTGDEYYDNVAQIQTFIEIGLTRG